MREITRRLLRSCSVDKERKKKNWNVSIEASVLPFRFCCCFVDVVVVSMKSSNRKLFIEN